jgi:hypothetical protein
MFTDSLFAPSRAYVTDRCGKWYAWHDFTSGTKPTLYVTGECWSDVPGVSVSLRCAAKQGPNPRILVLDRVVVVQPGAALSPPLAVRYEETTVARYTQVHIQPDALFIDVVVLS